MKDEKTDLTELEATGLESVSDVEPAGSEAGGENKPWWHRVWPWVAAGVAVCVCVGGGVAWSAHARNSAQAGCVSYSRQIKTLSGKPTSAKVTDALKVQKSDVADVKTWNVLQRDEKTLLRLERGPLPGCEASSLSGAKDQERTAESQWRALDKARGSVESDARAVLKSRDAKAAKDAEAALKAKIDQAKQLLESSAGNVADDATRSALSQAIDNANELLSSKNPKLADLQNASKALDDAINGVNASVQAKQSTDSQAQQQAQAPSQSSGYSGGGYTGGGHNWYVPAPSAPSSGGSAWQSMLENQKPLGNGCDPVTGACGIG